MKALLALIVALVAAPLAANPAAPKLAGVSDQETTIPYSEIQQVERGHGDVLFVRDRDNRWYRLGLNKGCLRGPVQLNQVVFNHNSPTSGIDRFTTIELTDDLRSCAIRSIRSSAPPPQVDSHSPVTLD
ncbi:MAG: hypothetical protein J2O44_01695 [Porphyrobacter sp.]|nr:hypothetical protein [Porphyrobacter sp.]